jgi:hypothetical protein
MNRMVAVEATPIAAAKAPQAIPSQEKNCLRGIGSSFFTVGEGAAGFGASFATFSVSAILPHGWWEVMMMQKNLPKNQTLICNSSPLDCQEIIEIEMLDAGWGARCAVNLRRGPDVCFLECWMML